MGQVWDKFVPEAELALFQERGFGGSQQPGRHAALLVVDVVETFLGPKTPDASTLDAPVACGPMGWDRLPNIASLLDSARTAQRHVIFSKGNLPNRLAAGGSTKMELDPEIAARNHTTDIAEAVYPLAGEWVLEKTKASAFNGTPLVSYLVRHGIDTLVVCGVSTSGCVRATVVDAFSAGFVVFVVEPACFDRSEFAHAANLFDIEQKYGTVIGLTDAEGILQRSAG